MSRPRDLLLVVVMVLLASLPFLGKGLRIDDTTYVSVAERILADPWRPYPVESVRSQGKFEINNPPLQQYVLAGIMALAGENWVALHAASALFLLVAGLAMYGLARRFCGYPLAATALLIMSPAVIPSQNLMLDVPLLGMGLASVYFYVRGTDERRLGLAMVGGVFLGLAILTKFNALPLAPLLMIYAMLKRQYRSLLAFLPALLIVGSWSAHDLAVYGAAQIASHRDASPFWMVLRQPRVLTFRLIFTLSCLGASCFLPVFLVPKRSRRRMALVGLIVVISALPYLGAFYRYRGQVTPAHALFATGLLATGIMAFVLAAERSRAWLVGPPADRSGRDDEIFLMSWMAGIVAFTILLAPFIAIRHFILALPPLVLLSCRAVNAFWPEAQRQAILSACCILTAGVGLAVACADCLQANLYELLGKEMAQACAPEIREGKAFFVGRWEWGYWAEKNGLRQVPRWNPTLRLGDLVVYPRTARDGPTEILEGGAVELVGTYIKSSWWPFRTFDRKMAGYYDMKSIWQTPYTISNDPMDEVRIVRCVRTIQLDGEFP